MKKQNIENRSKLLYEKAKVQYEKARKAFQDQTIKSEPNLIKEVFQAFESFFESADKPNMIPRYAFEEGPPLSKDYHQMMDEIEQDLAVLFQEIEILGKALSDDFSHHTIQKSSLTHQYQKVLDKLKDAELYMEFNQKDQLEVGRDDFLLSEKIDYEQISGVPLTIGDGALMLPQSSRTNIAQKAEVTIIPGNKKEGNILLGSDSNGFPGNHTEIHTTTEDLLSQQSYSPMFIGEKDSHENYAVVLDGKPNTWFEYEKVNIREHDRMRVAKNLGWHYQVYEDQSINWAEDPDDGVLRLHMKLTLDKEYTINEINVNMFTPAHYDAKTAKIKDIRIADSYHPPVSIIDQCQTKDGYHFYFSPRKAKTVSILFEQTHKYFTDIGHIYYEKKKKMADQAKYAMEVAKKEERGVRTKGPLITLEDLGLDVHASDNQIEVLYPSKKREDSQTKNMGAILENLNRNLQNDYIDMNIESFEGWRWCIGIRDIEIYSCTFEEKGELVTKPFYFNQPLERISLDVKELFPDEWIKNSVRKYDYIKYFISIDDGGTWHPITPIHHQQLSKNQPPKRYIIQQIESSKQQLPEKEGYLESPYPVYSIRLKIVATRPEQNDIQLMSEDTEETINEYQSPMVHTYAIKAKVKGVIEDSQKSSRMLYLEENPEIGPTDPGSPSSPIHDNPIIPEDDDQNNDQDNTGDKGDSEDEDGSESCDPTDPFGECYDPTLPEIPEYPEHITTWIFNKKSRQIINVCKEIITIEGKVKGPQPIKLVELFINEQFIKSQLVSNKTNDYNYTFTLDLTKDDYQIGDTFTVKVKGSDATDFDTDTVDLHIHDCDGSNDGSSDTGDEDANDDTSQKRIINNITNKTEIACLKKDISIAGYVDSTYELSHVVLFLQIGLNGIPIKLEEKTLQWSQDAYHFDISWETLEAKGIQEGTSIILQTKAFDKKGNTDTDEDLRVFKDCSTIDNPPSTDEETLKVQIDNKPDHLCICENLSLYGVVSGPNPITELIVRLDQQLIDPLNLGTPPANHPCENQESTNISNTNENIDDENNNDNTNTDDSKSTTGTINEGPIRVDYRQVPTQWCNNDNTFSFDVTLEADEGLNQGVYNLYVDGKHRISEEVSVSGTYGTKTIHFPMLQYQDGSDAFREYYSAGTTLTFEFQIKDNAGNVTIQSHHVKIKECVQGIIKSSLDNEVIEPSVDLSYFDNPSSNYNTAYWIEENGYNQGELDAIGIRPDFWEGRNDWLDYFITIGANSNITKNKINEDDVFYKHLYQFTREVQQDQTIVIPQPFSRFYEWIRQNIPSLSGSDNETKAKIGSIYASYILKKPAVIHTDHTDTFQYLEDGALEKIGEYINRVPSHTYHWMDFNDIKNNIGTLAWVLDIAGSFLSFGNMEESALSFGIQACNTFRTADYIVNQGESWMKASKTYNDSQLINHYVTTDHFGSEADIDFLSYLGKEYNVGYYAAAETIVHELGHAIANYGTEVYGPGDIQHKYANDAGRKLHDYDEWREIAGFDRLLPDGTDPVTYDEIAKIDKSNYGNATNDNHEAPVSAYGTMHPSEDFAEAFAMYIINPTLLEARWPQRFAFMEKYCKNLPKSIDSGLNVMESKKEKSIKLLNQKSCHHQKEKKFKHNSFLFNQMNTSLNQEESFSWNIPFWKIDQLGFNDGQSHQVEVIAYDDQGKKASDNFHFTIIDCDNVGDDTGNNGSTEDCYALQKVIVYYLDKTTRSIETAEITPDQFPYQDLDNGDGVKLTITYDEKNKAIAIMIQQGNDQTGYAFQVHAIGLEYQNNQMQTKTIWAKSIIEESEGNHHTNLILGNPTNKNHNWLEDIQNGDYSTAPSLGGLHDYIIFGFDNEWSQQVCPLPYSFDPYTIEEPETPQEIYKCNKLTDVILQYYDDLNQKLRIYKVDISNINKGSYVIPTQEGEVELLVGWAEYFQGPLIKIVSSPTNTTKNVLLTALGIVYRDTYGIAQTLWGKEIAFYTPNSQNIDFILGPSKTQNELQWVDENGNIDYNIATYIGNDEDMVAVTTDFDVNAMCVPENTIDDEVGIDPNQPPGAPRITFVNLPNTLCKNFGEIMIEATVTDDIGLTWVKYGILKNNNHILQDEIMLSNEPANHNIYLPLDQNILNVGDTIIFYIETKNVFNMLVAENHEFIVQNCDTTPPIIQTYEEDIPLDEESRKICYSTLNENNEICLSIQIKDDINLHQWTAQSLTWSDSKTYNLAVTDTGKIPLCVPIDVPAKETDIAGNTYIPDTSQTISIDATDDAGNTSTTSITLDFHDCSYVPDTIAPEATVLSYPTDPNTGRICYADLNGNDEFCLDIEFTDDQNLDSFEVTNGSGFTYNGNVSGTIDQKTVCIPINKPAEETSTGGQAKADIVFIIDTSGSMGTHINNVNSELNSFVTNLENQGVDARYAYIGSNFSSSQQRQSFVDGTNFNLNLSTNGGAWETLNWEQILDSTYGGMSFKSTWRNDADKFFIVVTDTIIYDDIDQLISDPAQILNSNNISASFICTFDSNGNIKEPDYERLATDTNGRIYNLQSANLSTEMNTLANDIATQATSYYPDSNETITIRVWDEFGNEGTTSHTLEFTDCSYNPIQSLVIDQTSLSIDVGDTISFSATATYEDGTTETITTEGSWSSTNTSVATMVDNIATGQSAGSATIIVEYLGMSDSVTLDVIDSGTPPELTSNEKYISLALWDNGSEDGDTISLYYKSANSSSQIILIENLTLSNNYHFEDLTLESGVNEIIIEGVNSGSSGQLTAAMKVFKQDHITDITSDVTPNGSSTFDAEFPVGDNSDGLYTTNPQHILKIEY